MKKDAYTISLVGRSYKIASSQDEEVIQRIAALTERYISEMMLTDKRIGFETAAAITALRFAEEIIRLQDDLTMLRQTQFDAHEKQKG